MREVRNSSFHVQCAALGFALALGASCNLEFREEKGGGQDSILDCRPQGAISYAQIRAEVLEPNDCLLCHGPGSRRDLSSYGRLRAQLSSVRESVLVTQSMPKDRPPVSSEQGRLLATWIENCAPEFAVDGGTDPSPVPSPSPSPSSSPSSEPSPSPEPSPSSRPLVRWNEVFTRVIEPKCVECHVSLRNIDAVRAKAAKVLDRAVVRSDMPKDPDTEEARPLSRDQKDVLVHWVVDGMLE